MRDLIILILFGLAAASIGAKANSMRLENAGTIPTKYETGEILKYKGRVFMLVETQTEYRPLISEEVSK